MTKRLEEVFNLSPSDEDTEDTPDIEQSTAMIDALTASLEDTDKIDAALPEVRDLNEHDRDMDDIHKKAMKTFDELVHLGMNVEVHAGAKIMETAATMLKTAMEAKDSKVDRKLRMISLQLQKARLDHAIEKEESKAKDSNEIESEGSVVIDRNELMRRIASASKNLPDDK